MADIKRLPLETSEIIQKNINPDVLTDVEQANVERKEETGLIRTQIDDLRDGIETTGGVANNKLQYEPYLNRQFNTELVDENGEPLELRLLETGDKEKDQLNALSANPKLIGETGTYVPFPSKDGAVSPYFLRYKVGLQWDEKTGTFKEVGETMDEIEANAKQLTKTYYNLGYRKSVAPPAYYSSVDNPLRFKNYGDNIEAEVTDANPISGYGGDVAFELAKRDVTKGLGKLWDATVGNVVSFDADFTFKVAREVLDLGFGKSRKIEGALGNKEKYTDIVDTMYAARDNFVDTFTVGDNFSLNAQNLFADDAKELAEGIPANTPENWDKFYQNKNDFFLLRYGHNLIEAVTINRAAVKALDFAGVGPKDAKKFFEELSGLTAISKDRKEFIKKTGFDFYKQQQIDEAKNAGKLVPSDGVLKKNYLDLASSTRSHYVNKAFGNFIQTKLGIKGGGAFFKQTQLALANAKFDLGKNVPVYYKGENIFSVAETTGYMLSGELFPDRPIINTLVSIGFGFGGVKLSNLDNYRRVRDPNSNVFERLSKTLFTSLVEATPATSPYTFFDSLLYSVDPLFRRFTNYKNTSLGKAGGLKEVEFKGRVENLKEIDRRAGITGRSEKYYIDKAFEDYGISSPDEPVNLNYFFTLTGAANAPEEVKKLITENKKEFKFLQDLADGINKITDPVVKERVLTSLREFKSLQTEIQQLKGSMKVTLAPGEVHPADQLSTALFNILPLYTTASAVRTMVQNAQAGYMKMINLEDAEILFQNAKTQIEAVSNLMQDLVERTKGGVVGEKIKNTIGNMQNFMREEEEILSVAEQELKELVALLKTSSSVDSFSAGKSALDNLTPRLEAYYLNTALNEIMESPDLVKRGEKFKRLQGFQRVRLQSLVNKLASDKTLKGEKSKGVVVEQVLENHAVDLLADGDLIYGAVYRKLKNVALQGDDVDNLILKFDDLLTVKEPSDFYENTINYNVKARAVKAINKSVRPHGDRIRIALEKAGDGDLSVMADAIRLDGQPIDLNNNFKLYRWYVSNKKNFTSEQIKEGQTPKLFQLFHDTFKDYTLDANTLIHMDRALSNRGFLLSKKVGENPDFQLELDNVNSLRDSVENIFRTNKNIPEGALTDILSAKDKFRDNVGIAKHQTIFDLKVERVDYTQKDEEMTEVFDTVREKVKKQKTIVDEKRPEKRYPKNAQPEDMLYNVGRLIASNNSDDIDLLIRETHSKFGTSAEYLSNEIGLDGKRITKRTRVIGNAADAEKANVVLNLAIETYVQKELSKLMKNYNPEVDEDLPQGVKDIFKRLLPGGSIYESMKEIERRTIIPNNYKLWSKKVDEKGEFIYDNSGDWLQGRIKTHSNQEDNLGKSTINFSEFNEKLQVPANKLAAGDKLMKKIVDNALVKIKQAQSEVGLVVEKRLINDRTMFKQTQQFLRELGVPAETAPDPDKLAEILLQDRTGQNIDKLKDFLKSRVSEGGYFKFVKRKNRVVKQSMSEKEALAEIDEYVESLVTRFFASKILVDADSLSGAGPKFSFKTKTEFLTGSGRQKARKRYLQEINKVPDLKNLLAANGEYGRIFEKILPEGEYDKVYALARKLSFDSRNILDEAAGVLGNAPTPMSVAMVLQRAFNLARGMVSVRWVGADAMIRAARLGNADIMREILTTRIPVTGEAGMTAVDVLHDMLVNGNFNKKNAVRFISVFPQILQNAEARFEIEEGKSAKAYSDMVAEVVRDTTGFDVVDSTLTGLVDIAVPDVSIFGIDSPATDTRPMINTQMDRLIKKEKRIPTGRIKREDPPRQESFLGSSPTDTVAKRREGRDKQRVKTDTIRTADILQDINI